MAANEDNSWRTQTFRQSVVTKIDEAIRVSGMPTTRNSVEMEAHVFQKAKNKEEYLGYVARLILHVREMRANPHMATGMPGAGGQMQQMPGQVPQQGQQMPPGMMVGPMMGQQPQQGMMQGQPQQNPQQGQMSPAKKFLS